MNATPSSLRAMLASVAACGFLLGCQAIGPHPANQPPFGSLAHITSMTPDASRNFSAGQKVQLKVDVRYVLTAETGTIMLIVLAADNSPIAQDVATITRGHGSTTLQANFTVPRTTQIRVYTPLIYQDQDSHSATDGRAFTVVPR
jgi:hypothetical protein